MSGEDDVEDQPELFKSLTAGEKSLERVFLKYPPRILARELVECCRWDQVWTQGLLRELCELVREAARRCPEKAAALDLEGLIEDPPLHASLLMERALVAQSFEEIAEVQAEFEELNMLIRISGLLIFPPMSGEDRMGQIELFKKMTAGEKSLKPFLLKYGPRSLARELVECCQQDYQWAYQGPVKELCELAREAAHHCPEKAAAMELGGSVMEDPRLHAVYLAGKVVEAYAWEIPEVEADFVQLIELIRASGLLSPASP